MITYEGEHGRGLVVPVIEVEKWCANQASHWETKNILALFPNRWGYLENTK